MREPRRLHSGRFENLNVLEGVGDVVLAANDVADAQVGVVCAGGQVIRRHAVAAEQSEIFDIGGGFGLLAEDTIFEMNHSPALARHAEAQRERFARRRPPVAFRARKLAHAGRKQPSPVLARTFRIRRAGRCEVAIRQVFGENRLRHFAV